MAQSVLIHLRVLPELKKELDKEASELGLSLNSYIRMLLIERKNKNEK